MAYPPDPLRIIDAADPCWCCGAPAPIRGEGDPWEGRLDSYCYACSLARCDAYPGECPHLALTLPKTDLTLDRARQKLAGWHFSQESLSKGEREILFVAEALLRLLDERIAA